MFGVVQVALLAAASPAPPAAGRGDQPPIAQVRIVCDQNCDCWQTNYRERRPILAGHDDLACPAQRPDRPPYGYYNGHYRSGPATGLGFFSRYPVREFSFPF
ncbi:hypothetical protein AXW67_34170 [Bradyrhizobium neotropicale]|uniref:Uncharacterized protein n=1 Tax=Bradyrhizobium neotropicale TaxID=1497615 RepID=A0A176ZH67_9BRAD|nr:hypothetical protein AXW67_34170 [Bradyrhizobium neotropicale]